MEEDKYRTVNAIAEGLYKEKGSRFISFIYPVKSEEEIKDIVTGLKMKYYDARHHCYAYCLGAPEISDHHDKHVGQIISNDLSNVLIVVIRYFGGIKLGVSGLIQAYKEAAADAINHAEVVERTVDEVIHVRFTYVVMNDVMKVLKEEEPDILSRNFEMECEITLSIRQKDMPRLRERLLKIESLSIEE